MDILNQFGFDIRLFIAQIINFLIIVFVFKKFLYKPLISILEKREKKIAQGLEDAKKAHLSLEKAEEHKDELLKKASLEADRILEEAKKQSELARNEMLDATKLEIEKMMQQTREQIQLEKENFRKESKDVSLEIAKAILESSITGLFDDKSNDALIKKGLQNIKNA